MTGLPIASALAIAGIAIGGGWTSPKPLGFSAGYLYAIGIAPVAIALVGLAFARLQDGIDRDHDAIET